MPKSYDNTDLPEGHKRCTTCGEVKSLDDFAIDRSRPDGYGYRCAECQRAYKRKYQAENRDSIKAKKRTYHQANRQRILEQRRGYREARRQELREKARVYRAANIERIKEWQRVYRLVNGERLRQYQKSVNYRERERYATDPEYRDRCRGYCQNRRARKLAAFVEDVSLDVLYRRDQRTCSICHKKIARCDATVDHIVPLSKGGKHSYQNTALACKSCNFSKSNRVVMQQMRLL